MLTVVFSYLLVIAFTKTGFFYQPHDYVTESGYSYSADKKERPDEPAFKVYLVDSAAFSSQVNYISVKTELLSLIYGRLNVEHGLMDFHRSTSFKGTP